MIYHPELYYFFDTKDFPLERALLVTAKAVSKYCKEYSAELVVPQKGINDKSRAGELPKAKVDREILIDEIFDWIKDNSEFSDMFALFLYGSPRNSNPEECDKFDHHDDTCCWALNLTDEEFKEVQAEWRKNDLPDDLFYNRDLGIQKGWHYYSPKQWEARNK